MIVIFMCRGPVRGRKTHRMLVIGWAHVHWISGREQAKVASRWPFYLQTFLRIKTLNDDDDTESATRL